MTARAALYLVALVALSGCERMGRVRECKRLAAAANPKLDQVEALAKKHQPADYRGAARIYASLSQDLRRNTTPTTTSKALVEEYVSLADSVVPALSAYALALESQDQQKLEEARRAIDRLAKRQHGVVARIDAYCSAP